jgi:hypothetical protein
MTLYSLANNLKHPLLQGKDTMGRRERCHGGIHDTAHAYYHAALDFGLKELALAIGSRSTSVLSKKLTPDNYNNALTEREAMLIFDVTKDQRILDAIAYRAGVIWIDQESIPLAPGEFDLFESGASFATAAAAVHQEICNSLADGEIDSIERARIEKRAFDLKQELQKLIDLIEPFSADNSD